jgi:hypothetical protein
MEQDTLVSFACHLPITLTRLVDSNSLDYLPYSFTFTLAQVIRSSLSPPSFPATFSNLVPSLSCAGRLALTFTELFVLLVEDDSKDGKALGEQQSQFASS